MISAESSILPVLVNAVGWALLHFLWQGALIACVTALLLTLMRNRRAQARYALACASLLLCLIAPLTEMISRLKNSTAGVQIFAGASSALASRMNNLELLPLTTWFQIHIGSIVLIWFSSVLLLSLRLSLGLFWLNGYHDARRSKADPHWQQRLNMLALQFGLKRKVSLRVVQDLASPITIGFLRPLVLLPASLMSGIPAPLLEALLAHELAHISRFDYVINLVQNFIEMLLFFHPAVWWISKTIRNEREHIADDLAARILGEPRRLALALSELERFQFTTPQLAQAAHGGNLMSRIKRLVRPETQALNWKATLSVLGLSAVCLAMYAHAAVPTEEPSTVKSAAPAKQKSGNEKNASAKVIPAMINFSQPGCRPEFPSEAARQNQTGTVTLSVAIAADGSVSGVKIDKSSHFELLDNAVRDKLLAGSCKNKPGTLDGKAVATTVKVQYVWKIN